MHLLDADICIHYLRGRAPQIGNRIADIDAANLGISVLTISELEFGVLASDRPDENRRFVAGLLARLVEIPFDTEAARIHAAIRYHLHRAGTPIGPIDMLVAASALANNATLVTNNVREFSRVPGLRIENWLQST